MAKIFSFPDGKAIEDVKYVSPEEQILESVKSNPEGAAMQILALSQANKTAIETIRKIFEYVSQYSDVWAKQIRSIIENNYKVASDE